MARAVILSTIMAAALTIPGVSLVPAAEPPAGKIPSMYVGKWTGAGEMSGLATERTGTATITTTIGHTVRGFSFEVAPDGRISGAGEATYAYKKEVDANLLVLRRKYDRRVTGPASVPFNIEGRVLPDGRVEIQSLPQAKLTVIDYGTERREMNAWDVFMQSGEVRIAQQGRRLVMVASPAVAANTTHVWRAEKVGGVCDCEEVAKAEELYSSYARTKNAYEAARKNLRPGDTFGEVQDQVLKAVGGAVTGETGKVIQYKNQDYKLTGRYVDPSGYPNMPPGQPDPRRSWDPEISSSTTESRYPIVNEVSAAHERGHVESLTKKFQEFKEGKIDWNTWKRFSDFDLTGKDLRVYIDEEIRHYEAGMRTLRAFIDKCASSCPAPSKPAPR
jgi:hypothetical protein